MKRQLFISILMVVSGLWMTMYGASERWCMPQERVSEGKTIRVGGTLKEVSAPCISDSEEEPCLPCLTIALKSRLKTYYVVSDDAEVLAILDTVSEGLPAIAEGIAFTNGSYSYLQVSKIKPVIVSEFQQRLIGNWQVYKTTITGSYQDENREYSDGGTMDFQDTWWNIDATTIDMQGPAVDNWGERLTYTLREQADGTWQIIVPYTYYIDYQQGTNEIILYTIHQLTTDRMEWESTSVNSDGTSTTFHEYLWRLPHTEPLRLNSLCDEWNVLAMRNPNTSAQLLRFSHYYLTTDTMINGLHYVQVQLNDQYKGALREDDNANIYYVPADSTHEYLLYAFHAQVGDELENLWVSYTNLNKDAVSDLKVTISEIKPTTPKTIVVDVSFTLTSGEVREHFNRQFEWLDGIGNVGGPFFANLLNGPINSDSNGDLRGVALLCAYKDGEHVYTSEWGEKYGCEYNYDPYSTPTDTIPLYIKDGPGTSTVEPVDPNQIVATLVGDMLSIYEYIGAEIGYKVSKAPTGNNMPARGKEMADDTFSESVSIQLKERGLYTLELTNPEWGYTIVGTFEYDGMQGIEPVETGVPAAQKILRNGQLLIRKGDRIYTVQGIELRE